MMGRYHAMMDIRSFVSVATHPSCISSQHDCITDVYLYISVPLNPKKMLRVRLGTMGDWQLYQSDDRTQ